MSEKKFRQLRIDPEFKNLIRPLRREEYRQLELNLVREGCREDIVVWNNTIVDGHNRYEICNKLHIPYGVYEREFPNRDAVIAWICSNQLGRRNITEETRKYLIGRQYEAEKKAQKTGMVIIRIGLILTLLRRGDDQLMRKADVGLRPGSERSIMCLVQPYKNMQNIALHWIR